MASSPPVSQSPELISADRSQGSNGMSMEVGSPTSPVLPGPTSASTPAARSESCPSVCTPAPEVSRHRPVCAPDGFRDSYSTNVSHSTSVSTTSEKAVRQAEPAEAAAAAAAPTVWYQAPKQNQNQVQLPKFNGKGNLRSYLNQLDNAAVLGHWTTGARLASVMPS